MITKSLRFLFAIAVFFLIVFLSDFYLSHYVFSSDYFPNVVLKRVNFSKEGVLKLVYPDGEKEFTKANLGVRLDYSDYKKVVERIRQDPSSLILRLGLYLGLYKIEVSPRIVYKSFPLAEFLESLKYKYNIEPQDARFVFENGKVKEISLEKPGKKVDEEEFWKEVKRKISSWYGKENLEVKVKIKKVEPKIKLSQINSFGIKELIGVGSSSYKGSIWQREHNIILATKRISGSIVAPGEVFSFNKALGDVSVATGYKQSYIIKDGKTVLGDGGGVCQVSTTLFRAVLNAGLPVVERHAHSYRVGYYEQDSKPGFDATVFAPYVDFKFKNDMLSYVLIQGKIDRERKKLYFYLYGKKDGRRVFIGKVKIFDVVPPPEPLYIEDPTLPTGKIKQIDFAAAGAKVYFDYQVIKEGRTIFEKTFKSVYRPWQAVYLVGKKV